MALMHKMQSLMMQMILVIFMLTASARGATCPPPPENETYSVEESLHYSDVVVLGDVLKQIPDPYSPALYTAQLQVHCVYKGKNVPNMINITHAGNTSEPCDDRHFQEGQQYLAYLYDHGDKIFTPAYPQHPGGYSDEVYIMCNVTVSYPIGVDKDKADVKCEDSADYESESCIPMPTFMPKKDDPRKAFRHKVMPNQPGKVEKIEDDSDPLNGSPVLRMSLALLGFISASVWLGL